MKCTHTAAKSKQYGACNFTIDPEDHEVGNELTLGDIEKLLMEFAEILLVEDI